MRQPGTRRDECGSARESEFEGGGCERRKEKRFSLILSLSLVPGTGHDSTQEASDRERKERGGEGVGMSQRVARRYGAL